MTGMYNVLEKLRSGETLTDADRVIHERGLVSVLKQLHDEIDAAVFEAYGWSDLLSSSSLDTQILERLVALNAERAAEETRGQIRWLRPEWQQKVEGGGGTVGREAEPEQSHLALPPLAPTTHHLPPTSSRCPWPQALPDQVRVLRELLSAQPGAVSADALARQLTRARADRVEELLQTLVTLGRARQLDDGRYIAA
jgi:hypothetical protein